MRTFRNALYTLRTGFSIRISAVRQFSSTPVRCINYKSLPELRQLIEEKRCIVVSGTSHLDTDDIIRFKFGRYGEIEDIVRPLALDPTVKDRSVPNAPKLVYSELVGIYDKYLYVVFSKPETAAEVLRVAQKTPFQYARHLYTVEILAKSEALHLNALAVGEEGKEPSISHDTFRLNGFSRHYGPDDISRELSSFGSLLSVKAHNGRKFNRPIDVKFADLQSILDIQSAGKVGALRLDGHSIGIRPTRTLVTPSSSIFMSVWVLRDKAYFEANISRLTSEIRQHLHKLSSSNGLPAPEFDKSMPYILPQASEYILQYFPYFRFAIPYNSIDVARRANHVFTAHSRSRPGWVLDAEYKRGELDTWWTTVDDFKPEHAATVEQTPLRVPGRKNWGGPGPD